MSGKMILLYRLKERLASIHIAEEHVVAAARIMIGWHVAYQGVWALTSTWDYSWSGCFRCAHWLFGGALRAVGNSAAMGAIDAAMPWMLIAAGFLLIVGCAVRPAAALCIMYFTLMYILDPPHLGNTGESHFMYIDRNVVETSMLFCVMFWKKPEDKDVKGNTETER